MRHAAAILLVLAAAGCAPAGSAPAGTGRVHIFVHPHIGGRLSRKSIYDELDLSSIAVAVTPAPAGTGIPSRTERVVLTERKGVFELQGVLELPAGKYRLWLGAALSPPRQFPHVAPRMEDVEVRADTDASLNLDINIGGIGRFPTGLGLPSASHGRLEVLCSRGLEHLDRWISLGPDGGEDVLWPPLAVGDWELVVKRADGSVGNFRVRIDGKDPAGAEVSRR